MREEITKLVYPTLEYGLKLHERLQRNEPVTLEKEQAHLRGLLQTRDAARRWPDYAGDGEPGGFLGIRYALTCWLDEIFIAGSKWSAEWNEKKLETALYGSNDRAFLFWEQAKIAEARSEIDALEAYYLCVMLGFRGDLGDDPRIPPQDEVERQQRLQRLQRLLDWRQNVETQIGQRRSRSWAGPPELPPITSVPPLVGRQRFYKAVVTLGIVIGVMIPVATALLVKILQGVGS
jgi:type VI secretion system protein ImpK